MVYKLLFGTLYLRSWVSRDPVPPDAEIKKKPFSPFHKNSAAEVFYSTFFYFWLNFILFCVYDENKQSDLLEN